MRISDFDYELPPHLVAQQPSPDRSGSRLMRVDRTTRSFHPGRFSDLPECLRPGDLLVLNNSRVFPARLHGQKQEGGGHIEVLLLQPAPEGGWWVLLRPGKRVRAGTRLTFASTSTSPIEATVLEKQDDGRCRLDFGPQTNVLAFAEQNGEMPLPPYIQREAPRPEDRDRYQTVYARHTGSVAAPTAGLHFTVELLEKLRGQGVQIAEVTLHVGIGTFSPVKVEDPSEHIMHTEHYEVLASTAEAIHRAKSQGNRVVAVGTTSLRVLESVARRHGSPLKSGSGTTDLFLYPPAPFHVVDALITNFHLPRSTLLMLVSAFAAPGELHGRDLILAAYREAVKQEFRFFSYGDAMWIA